MTRRSLTQGNLFASLLAFALPLMLANILQAIYGATDLVVVGQFADSASVSAVATGSQIMQTVTGIISSLSIGVTILVGQFLGTKNSRAAAIALQDAMTSVSFLIIMAIINKRGLIASAVAGVVDKSVVFAMLPPMSFMSTIAAFTAQNIGAKRPERAKKSWDDVCRTILYT